MTDIEAKLRDGGRIAIRALRPEDRQVLRDGFERLSPESRYRRFFGPMPALSERDLDYLTDIDHHDHEALLAIDAASGDGIGVARYVRTGPDCAEPAIVVVDEWQGRGVGSRLLGALAQRAREEDVKRFEAAVLATNDDAIGLLERLGQTSVRRQGPEVELTIELPEPGEADGRWRELLRQVATGAVQPTRTLLERLWPRRPGSPHDERANVIVVGTDGSEDSGAVVEKAAELALASGARVELLAVQRLAGGNREELARAVSRAAESLRERGITAGVQLRRGDPGLVLTDVAAELQARLLVVGAGRRARGARRIISSVSDYVARRSPCDVLILRPRAGEDAERDCPRAEEGAERDCPRAEEDAKRD